MKDINWDSFEEVSTYIHEWAQRTFPGRNPKSSVTKLGMEEIPELLIHLKEKGTKDIGQEWADCLILLLDLARIWGINPFEAIRAKMEINERRMWVKEEETGFYNHVKTTREVIDMPRRCNTHRVLMHYDNLDGWYCPDCEPYLEKR